jgi:hypothetical protein
LGLPSEVVYDPTDPSAAASTLKYADTIAVVDQGWPDSLLRLMDYEGNNGIASIIFDVCGAKFVKVEVSALDSGLIITPILRYYS